MNLAREIPERESRMAKKSTPKSKLLDKASSGNSDNLSSQNVLDLVQQVKNLSLEVTRLRQDINSSVLSSAFNSARNIPPQLEISSNALCVFF